jgi:uncharacterized protein YkwD
MKSRYWLSAVALCFGVLLAACGGTVADPGQSAEVVGGNSTTGTTETRVKESASLASAPVIISASTNDGPAARGATGPTADVAGVCLNQEEARLGVLINEYRASLNLPPLQISKSLSLVAQQHVWDSINNRGAWPAPPPGKSCNLHSWSGVVNPALTEGRWTEVCYTSDHANAAGMWSKPREIAGYPADGVENSFATSGTATAEGALNAWKNSPGHNNVITQQGGWGPMAAIGVGVSGGIAHLWLSWTADPVGEAPLCAGVTLAAPTVEPTAVPPTAVPPTEVPPTAVPPTEVPPTAIPTEVPATAAATAEQPTVAAPTEEPTAVSPTAVPPTTVPPTAVPPTTAAAPTGVILNENGTITAGSETVHTFPIFGGRTYTMLVTPSAEFDVAPAATCRFDDGRSQSFDFDWDWEGQPESFTFTATGQSNGSCQLTISGYQGSTGTYKVEVTAN